MSLGRGMQAGSQRSSRVRPGQAGSRLSRRGIGWTRACIRAAASALRACAGCFRAIVPQQSTAPGQASRRELVKAGPARAPGLPPLGVRGRRLVPGEAQGGWLSTMQARGLKAAEP